MDTCLEFREENVSWFTRDAKSLLILQLKTLWTITILLLVASGVSGTSKSRSTRKHRAHRLAWGSFAPGGLGFRISVPSKPQRIRDWIGDNDKDGYASVDAFGVVARSQAFVIVALLPSAAMLKQDGGQRNLGGLWWLIGGDDYEPASELSITVKGLAGKEYIYHFSDGVMPHRRGWVIDGGRRIFVLIYFANSAASLNSRRAMRFFDSFKVIHGKAQPAEVGALTRAPEALLK